MYFEGCSPLLELINGDINIVGVMVDNLYAINSSASYVCDTGFELSILGTTPRYCQYDGWSETAPTCNPVCKYDLHYIGLIKCIHV